MRFAFSFECQAGALLLGKVILRGKYVVRTLWFFFSTQCTQIRCGCIFNAVEATTSFYNIS